MVNIDGPEMLVTRDLLGELSKARNNNNNDNMKGDHIRNISTANPQEPTSFNTFLHRHHHLKVETQKMSRRSNSPDSPLSSSSIHRIHPNSTRNSNEIAIFPSHTNPISKPLSPEEESCSLELKLNPSTATTSQYNSKHVIFESELVGAVNVQISRSFNYQTSVICTLDKVKSALERAEKKSMEIGSKKRPSSNDKDLPLHEEERTRARAIVSNKGGAMFAAGCPGCLLYVIASRDDPKCPRCNYSFLPNCDGVIKKPRIDLNDVGFDPIRYGSN